MAVLSGVLFLSGSGALVFQTLWLRLSGLTFGNSVWSTALILSSFMTGLALGNAIAASSRRRRRPLHLYAGLELIVALTGSTLVFSLPQLGAGLRPVFQGLWGDPVALAGLRLALAFVILLVPTTAMGLTFPTLLDDDILQGHDFGRTIGWLYGWNTLGAVAGALVGDAFLIKTFGLRGTGVAAAAMDGVAAGSAWLLARSGGTGAPARRIETAPWRLATSYRRQWRLLLISLGCGGIMLCLEVVWFRFLRLYVASSATAFAAMLAVVLAGIGLGGLASGALERRGARSGRLLPALLLLAALATLLSYAFFPVPVPWRGSDAFYIESGWRIARLSLALMFPVAFVSGVIFPVIVTRVQTGVGGRMNSAGITTLFNTIGAAAGPLLAGFVLLPRAGFQTSLLLCAAGYTLLAVFAGQAPDGSWAAPRGRAAWVLGAALVLSVALFPYHRAEGHLANARRPYEADGSRRVVSVEGTADTLQVLRRDLFGEPYYYRLVTNGYSMSGTMPRSQRYMRMFAYLPLALRPESTDALLICYGVGVTADALLHDPQLRRLDIVDIAKEVFALAGSYAESPDASPLRDPRVTTHVQDGRFFLQASPRQYDLITGEPPPLKVAGTVNLYTEEFFSLLRARLKEGGMATFWLPIWQLRVDEVKAILAAFHHAFPNASVWAGPDEEWILLGINGPGRTLTADEIGRLWSIPATRADLTRIGLEVPGNLWAQFLMDRGDIEQLTQGVAPLTDRYPKRLTDLPPDPKAIRRFAAGYFEVSAAWHRFLASPLIARLWPEGPKTALEPFFVDREIRYTTSSQGGNWLATLDLYLRSSSLRTPVLEALNSDEFRVAIARRQAGGVAMPPAATLPDLVADALARRDVAAAVGRLETERIRGFANPNDLFLLIYLDCLNGHVDAAEVLATAAAGSIQKDWFVDWLWQKLEADFGFHPPP